MHSPAPPSNDSTAIASALINSRRSEWKSVVLYDANLVGRAVPQRNEWRHIVVRLTPARILDVQLSGVGIPTVPIEQSPRVTIEISCVRLRFSSRLVPRDFVAMLG